jgi:hypothetical protein
MALPSGTTGSLRPAFAPARPVGLAVKLPSAFTLYARLPTALREPLRASVTLWEATAPVKLPACHGLRGGLFSPGLEPQHRKGGISPLTPHGLATAVHSLPPILHIQCQSPMAGYSKGARGLFVLSRVLGILTETPISPSSRKRQRPSRYAIRAGRNLPDKEFRYLRTVIVTAAVYRGFSSKLRLAADLSL